MDIWHCLLALFTFVCFAFFKANYQMEWSCFDFELQEILQTPVIFAACTGNSEVICTVIWKEEAVHLAMSFMSIEIMHFFGVK